MNFVKIKSPPFLVSYLFLTDFGRSAYQMQDCCVALHALSKDSTVTKKPHLDLYLISMLQTAFDLFIK